MKLVADSEGEILPGLPQQGHVGLVGTEGDEGGRGQRSIGVKKMGRVEANLRSNIIQAWSERFKQCQNIIFFSLYLVC